MADPDTDSDDLESMFDFLDGSDERRPYGRVGPPPVTTAAAGRSPVPQAAPDTATPSASDPVAARPVIRPPVPVSQSGVLRPPRPGEPLDLTPVFETDGRRVDPVGKAAPARRRRRPDAPSSVDAPDGGELPVTERIPSRDPESGLEAMPDNVTPFPQPADAASRAGSSARSRTREPSPPAPARPATPDPEDSLDGDDTLALGVGDDFAFLDRPSSGASARDGMDGIAAGARFDPDLLDGVHRPAPDGTTGSLGWRTALGLGAAALVVAGAALGVRQLMNPGDATNASDEVAVVQTDVAVDATVAGSPSLGDRFRARLAEIEALLGDGRVDEADAVLGALDLAVYGYGRNEFEAIEVRIAAFRQTGELPPAIEGASSIATAPTLDGAAAEDDTLPRERAEAEAEADRLAAEQAEAERVEAERLAAERAEAERLAAEQAEAERLAAERAEVERLAAEQAAAERLAAERAEAERLVAEQAEAERLAAERARAERLAAERAATDRRIAEARLEAEREAAAERAARQRAEAEARAAADRAAAEAVAAADAERLARERAEARARIAEERAAALEQERADRADAEARALRERQANEARRRELDRAAAERAAAARAEAAAERLARADLAGAGTPAASPARSSAQASTPSSGDAVEPTLSIQPRAIGDDELQAVYQRFSALEAAIEAGDINRVIGLTRPSARRIQQFLQLFENSNAIEARITGVSTSSVSGSITGSLRIESIERSNGVRTAPSPELASITLTSERSGADWSAIDW